MKNKTVVCRNCGNLMNANDKFCEHCGSEAEPLSNENFAQLKNNKKSIKKIVVVISAIALVVVLLVVLGVIIFAPKSVCNNEIVRTVGTTQQLMTEVSTTEEYTTIEPTTDALTTAELTDFQVSDSEIKKAEELLKKEPFGTDEQSDGSLDMFNVDKDEYYGRLNVYDAIHYYVKGASLEAQRNPDGSISMKYTATSNGADDELTHYSEGFYVTYIVNIDDGTVYYDDDTLHTWEINKGYYSTDLVNELSN